MVMHAGCKDLEVIVWDEGDADGEDGTCLGEAIIDTRAWARGGTYELTQVLEGGGKVLVSVLPLALCISTLTCLVYNCTAPTQAVV